MTSAAALAVSGPPLRQRTNGSQIVYALRAPWAEIVTEYGIVRRVSTGSSECRTERGIRPGAAFSAVREAYASASASLLVPLQGGEMLSYPFVGVAFVLRGGRVETVEVFRPEGTAATARQGGAAQIIPVASPRSPGSPAGPPSTAGGAASVIAPGTWGVRSSSARVEDSTLVVSGTVENRSRAQSAYADVRVFNSAGRQVASGDSPLYPSPVPGGATATFEVRLTIEEVVRRYTVTIRPSGSITQSLAEHAGEIRDAQRFSAIVARQVLAELQTTSNPPSRESFVLVVTNGSPLTIVSLTVMIELTATCRVRIPAPVRPFREVLTARVVVEQVRPGASARVPVQLSEGPCAQFETWSAQARVGELRVSD